jgi:putative membrane protein
MAFQYLKALHLIFMVTWFAGLFYIVRLFVYQTEANDKEEPEKSILVNQFKLMSKRLWYGITWPSLILIVGFASWMLWEQPVFLKQSFMHLKLAFVVGLVFYHFGCHSIFKQLQSDQYRYSSLKLRVWNEVATLFLVAIIFIIVLRDAISTLWGVLGLIAIAIMLWLAIHFYRKKRQA